MTQLIVRNANAVASAVSADRGNNALGTAHTTASEPDYALLGKQLTEQYHRATGGMREVIKFGAMMMMLRAHQDQLVQRGQASAKGTKGDGLKALLEQHAPEIKRSTAYRFEDVSRAVSEKFQLDGRVAKKLSFEQLVTSEREQLPQLAQKAQQDLFAFVDGTSQKSWLDDFKPPKASSYDRSEKGKGKTGITAGSPLKQAEEILLPAAQEFVTRWREGLWVHLPHPILEQIDGDLMDIRKQIKKALEK